MGGLVLLEFGSCVRLAVCKRYWDGSILLTFGLEGCIEEIMIAMSIKNEVLCKGSGEGEVYYSFAVQMREAREAPNPRKRHFVTSRGTVALLRR